MPRFIRFTDRSGETWRVYEFSVIAGRIRYTAPGSSGAQYKGFVPDPRDHRPRRTFMMLPHLRPEDRHVDVDALQRQLDASELYFQDDPAKRA